MVRCAGDGSFVHTISTDTLTLLAHHASEASKRSSLTVRSHYRGVIMHDGLSVHPPHPLANASGRPVSRRLSHPHLIDVGIYHRHTAWTTAMRTVLHDTQLLPLLLPRPGWNRSHRPSQNH